jgi:hypothetical protein
MNGRQDVEMQPLWRGQMLAQAFIPTGIVEMSACTEPDGAF